MLGLIALVVALSLFPADRITGPQPRLPQSSLVIETKRGPVRLTIELATTRAQQQHGLMFRPSIAPDAGMLFVYATERPHSFWMKNTLVPLDILFVKASGLIARIAANTTPLSEEPIPSSEPVIAVLEIAGGRAAQLGITVGDEVRHPALGNSDNSHSSLTTTPHSLIAQLVQCSSRRCATSGCAVGSCAHDY